MKYIHNKSVYLIVTVVIVLLSNCTKNVAGPQGDPGAPGKKGNVIQSHINSFTQPASAWSFTGNWWTSVIYAPQVTNNLMSKGEVKVYMQIGDKWWDLPYAVGDVFMEVSIEPGIIHLKYSKIHDGPPEKPGPINFRLVFLEPV